MKKKTSVQCVHTVCNDIIRMKRRSRRKRRKRRSRRRRRRWCCCFEGWIEREVGGGERMIGKSGGEEKEGEKVGNVLYGTKQEQEDITMRAIIILKEESEQTGQA